MSWKASAWAKEQRVGSPFAKSILMCLGDGAHPETNDQFSSQEYLAAAAEVSPRTLREWLGRFERWGLIRRDRRTRPDGSRSADRIVVMLDCVITDGADRLEAEKRGEAFPQNPQDVDVQPAIAAGRTNRQQATHLPAMGDTPTGSPRPPLTESNQKITEERERAGAWADDGSGQDREIDPAETPGRAAFEKRVQRFCNGEGYRTGPWKNWDKVTIGYIAKQFAGLSPEDRAEAERWRDPYLHDLAGRKVTPPPLGPFLAQRHWQALDTAMIERFERFQAAKEGKPKQAEKPDGWAACMGPVGMAWLFGMLLKGPEDADAASLPFDRAEDPSKAFFMGAELRKAWPHVDWFQRMRSQAGGTVFQPKWHALKPAMEPVPAGTDVLDAWRQAFAERRWPWLVPFDQADVVYCPKGGPTALEAFCEKMIEAGGAQQEAAE